MRDGTPPPPPVWALSASVETNFFGSGWFHFTDPIPPQMPQRFHRVRQWP
jgi:hypothetical protein